MKVRFLKATTVRQLLKDVPENLHLYRGGDFQYLLDDATSYFEVGAELDESRLNEVALEGAEADATNAKIVYEAFDGVTPYMARDERLWVYMTHIVVPEYTRHRWPLPKDDEKAASVVKKHFFGAGRRGLERDNSMGRLWWFAHVCSRVRDVPLDEALTVLLHRTDVRANILERPTTSRSEKVFSVLISELAESLRGDQRLWKRPVYRKAMKNLNLLGGVRLLDAVGEKEIRDALSV